MSELIPSRSFASLELSRRSVLRGAGLSVGAAGLAALLAACSPAGVGGGKGSGLSFWNFYSDDGSTSPVNKWMLKAVGEWNKNNDSKVKLRFVPTSDYVNGTTLPTAFSSGQGPDIFLISPGDFLRYANGGVLFDLSPYISESLHKDFLPSVIAGRSVDGKVLGIPMESEPLALYYSMDAFESAGLSEADVPKTWDEMINVADKLTTDDRFGVLFETAPGYYQNFTWYPFMWSGGGEVFDKSNNVIFDSKATQAALELWGSVIDLGVAPRTTRGDGAGDAAGNLGSGFTAMQQSGVWSVNQFAQQKPDFRYGVTKLPTPAGGKDVTDLGGWAICVNAKGRDPESAAKFAVWLAGAEDKAGVDRMIEWNSVAKSNLPVRQSVIDRAAAEGAYKGAAIEYFLNEVNPTGRPEPRFPAEVYKPISDAIQGVQLNGQSASEAAARAHEQLEKFAVGYKGAPIL